MSENASPPVRTRTDRIADALMWGVVLAVAAAHFMFIIRDVRIPQDLGQYYTRVPYLFNALFSPADLFRELRAALPTPGGWYQLLIAVVLRIVGRSPMAFQLFDVFWVAAVVALSGLVGRQVGSSRAGLVAACLSATFPMIVVQGRSSWIHVPEVALVLSLLWAWLRDPQLLSRRTVAWLSVGGFLVITLRPSGIGWVGSLVVLLGSTAWDRRKAVILRVLLILLVWAAGVSVILSDLPTYFTAKMAARERYALSVPDLSLQFRVGMGWLPTGFALLAGILGVLRPPWPPAVLLAAWTLIPFGLVAIFGAGLDNFPVFCAGLAILGGRGLAGAWPDKDSLGWRRGLSDVAGRVAHGTWLALPIFLLSWIPQWFPNLAPTSKLAQLFVRAGFNFRSAIEDYRVPYTSVGDREILALADASCPDPTASCDILVDQGLFRPYAEDPGFLELFLARFDHVKLWETRMPAKALENMEADALVQFDCGPQDLSWRQRYPFSLENLFSTIEKEGLATAWMGAWSGGCTVMWMVPQGRFPDPSRVMQTWGQILPPPLYGSGRPEPGSDNHPYVHEGAWQDMNDPRNHAPGRRDEK